VEKEENFYIPNFVVNPNLGTIIDDNGIHARSESIRKRSCLNPKRLKDHSTRLKREGFAIKEFPTMLSDPNMENQIRKIHSLKGEFHLIS
jgi:hypothetical protein